MLEGIQVIYEAYSSDPVLVYKRFEVRGMCTLFHLTDILERETMQSSTVYVAALTIALQFDSRGILPVCLCGILLIKEVVNGTLTVSVLMPDLQ
jgi:hypothetical protein